MLGVDHLETNDVMDFRQFMEMNKKFPGLMYPAQKLQSAMQERILGRPFWDSKKEEMAQARKHIRKKRDATMRVIEGEVTALQVLLSGDKKAVIALQEAQKKARQDLVKAKEERRKKKRAGLL